MMAGIRGRDTRPELAVRRALHALGFRYRLHAKDVPGRPDIVLPRYRAAVFVHGCFWHGHDCRLFRLPDTRREFWSQKIERNRQRDAQVSARLREAGWRQLVIWECSMRGGGPDAAGSVALEAAGWLRSDTAEAAIRGE